jgi:hypothetical protein
LADARIRRNSVARIVDERGRLLRVVDDYAALALVCCGNTVP